MSADENAKFDQERMEKVKANLMSSVMHSYRNFIGLVKTLPLDNNLLQCAMMNFDQGILWTREAISILQFKVEEKPITTENENATNQEFQQEGNTEEHQGGDKIGSEASPSCGDSVQCGKEGETDGA